MTDKKPLTRPSLKMFAPYRQTIVGFLLVTGLVIAMIVLVQLFLTIGS